MQDYKCQWVLKKGSRRGLQCGETCTMNTFAQRENYCSKHLISYILNPEIAQSNPKNLKPKGPTLSEKILAAVRDLSKEGRCVPILVSRQKIKKYMTENRKIPSDAKYNQYFSRVLRRLVVSGKLVKVRGSYRLGPTPKEPKTEDPEQMWL